MTGSTGTARFISTASSELLKLSMQSPFSQARSAVASERSSIRQARLAGEGDRWQPAAGPDHVRSGRRAMAAWNPVLPALVARLGETAALVTHDIGNMVGYAFAAQYRERVLRFVVWTRRCRAWAEVLLGVLRSDLLPSVAMPGRIAKISR